MENEHLEICKVRVNKYCKGASQEDLLSIATNANIILHKLLSDIRFTNIIFDSLVGLAVKTANFYHKGTNITYSIDIFYNKVMYKFINCAPSFEDALYHVVKGE